MSLILRRLHLPQSIHFRWVLTMTHSYDQLATSAEAYADSPGSGFFRRLLAASAADWHVSPRAILLLWSLPAVIFISTLGCRLISKDWFKRLTGEDGIMENFQAFLFFAAMLLALAIARNFQKRGEPSIAIFYFIVSSGLLFVVGEEISWGQRLFDWNTPEFMGSINLQNETTLHNIAGVYIAFKWIKMLVGAYGAFLPLALFHFNWSADNRKLTAHMVPHASLAPYFAFLFLWTGYRIFFEPPKGYYFTISELSEVAELIFAMGVALFMIYQWKRSRAAAGRGCPAGSRRP
ncbi:MAG: hypothetical protein M3Z21_05795 [Pseudomonadota bacterium]|nr:hypothetical protein [Pseudomonadota bacterium]